MDERIIEKLEEINENLQDIRGMQTLLFRLIFVPVAGGFYVLVIYQARIWLS